MKKAKYIFLSIITFGIFNILTKKKAKKLAVNVNDELVVCKTTNVDVNQLVEDLGGISNIVKADYTISTFKVTVIDPDKVNNEIKDKYGFKGTIKSKKVITYLSGDDSQTIATAINNLIKK